MKKIMATHHFARRFCFICLSFLFVFNLSAQTKTINYDNGGKQQGINLIDQDQQHVLINVSINRFSFHDKMIGSEKMNSISLKNVFLQGEPGNPDLPSYSHYLAIPQGSQVHVNVIKKQTVAYQNISITPAPRIPLDTDQGPLEYIKNEDIYSRNSVYPEKIAFVSEPMKIRGVDVVILGVSPFQYNPVTKELLVHRDIEIEVKFKGGNGIFGEDRLRNRWWDPIIKDMVLNDESIPEVNYYKPARRAEDGCEYLIITPNDNDFIAWADSIKKFRVRQGITTMIVTTEEIGGNNTSAIENYIDDAYNNWDTPPVAVLLLADYGNSGATITSPVYDNYCISDNIYADVDGDYLPDMIFARITAQNAEHLETMIMKFLDYERNPPTSPDFYNHPITAMGWQTERWFQLCSEIVAGFFEQELGMSPVRENAIYDGNPGGGVWSTAQNTGTIIEVFGEEGLGYIPDSPSYLDDWGGNASRINEDINNGAFVLQHRDHGSVNGWGEPAYSTADINGLTNDDLIFVFSINCLTGKFDEPGECFAEKFHRHPNGALGIIAATEVSYSFVNDAYLWGVYDNLWPDFLPQFETEPESRDVLPAFGNAGGKYFLEQSSWPYNSSYKELTFNLFHHHGDAFSTVYYQVPQYLNVDHDAVLLSGLDFFPITVNDGAFICLSIDGQIIATAEGTGNEIEIEIPPQDIGTIVDIVITKQNYYRYENTIEVIPPNGPYCMYDEHVINDTCGNGNDKADYDEDILVSLIMKNLGNHDAYNVQVSLSTGDNFIEFIDPVEEYDTIRSGDYINRELAYKFHVSDAIPDQRRVQFDVTAKDENDSTWNSKFFMVARAPKIEARELIIDDAEFGNDNGRLDPGEKASIKVRTVNIGHSNAYDVKCTLIAYNQYILVEQNEQIIPVLSLFGASYPAYSVTVSEDAPDAVIAQMNYNISAAGYSVNKIYYPKIGVFLEDWETGNFEKYDWVNGGNQPWEITTLYPYQGYFHARSGAIDHNESSSLSITYKVMSNDNIKFYKKVSSELDVDKLSFYIDGQLRGSWSGTSQGWTQESFPVSPGTHTFKWEYKKNYSGEAGADCAWLDNIELPTELVTTVFAGPDSESCYDESFQCIGLATNQQSLQWVTDGDGSFDNPQILNPVYSPGSSDFENGQVLITLENHDNDGNVVTDEMNLSFIDIPDKPEIPEGPVYIDVYKETETDYTIQAVNVANSYNWMLSPEDAGLIISNDTNATVYWNNEFLGEVTISVTAVGVCGEGEYSDGLNIFVDNTVGLIEKGKSFQVNVVPNPNHGRFTIQIQSNKTEPIDVDILNMLGNKILSRRNVQKGNEIFMNLNTESLAPGIYLLITRQGHNSVIKKFVISK